MSFALQKGDVQISPAVFGGLVTVQAAATLPAGVSPDNQDCAFLPGSVFSRAALQKVFTIALPAVGSNPIPTVAYGKTFTGPTGAIENLYLAADGTLYWEDPVGAPGVYNSFGTVAPASWAKSITAFGREFIAFSDGLHGTDIPLQWDGTNLDRITQDGPGAPPTLNSFSLPSVGMVPSGALVLTITESDPQGLSNGYFTYINSWTSTSVATLNIGDAVTLGTYAGASAPMNGQWTVTAIYPGSSTSLVQLAAYLPSTTVFSVAAATGTVLTGTMVRQGNTVTVNAATAHQLQVGYQVLIASVPPQPVGGGISAIKIANSENPGIATITTASAHGLIPNLFVSIAGVTATAIGSGIAAITRAGQIVSVTTNSAHGLAPGAIVTLAGVTPTSFNSTVQVLNIVSTTIFTFAQVDTDASGSGGTISITWPVPDTATPSYFQVLAAPTPTTFQVAVAYSDGNWASGTVSYAWNGTFFVNSVPSATSFQYQQYGPNTSTGSTAGTVTPYGQAAPGVKQCQVLFLTRQGYITRGSPPVKVVCSGGQYLAASNLPIGPANVVARILAFTGASGSTFFYLPSTPQVNGQIVGTSTQINDNTTIAATLDFSDPTLFAGLGISIPGNDVQNQLVLDGALGFGLYASRLITWGQRNRIQNFLNLSFDGGQFYNALGGGASNLPCGWTPSSPAGGALAAGHFGDGWQASGAGSLAQSAYEDAYGAPILTAAKKYKLRAWVNGTGKSLTATIASASSGFSATATVAGTALGAFGEANFSQTMPSPIPADMLLTLTWTSTPLIDEISIIYQDNPYLETVLYASYPNNPEAFDGVTGKFGASKDQKKVMDISDIRDTGYLLTQDPGGRLHEFTDNGVTEPAGWNVREVAANCGLLSAFGLTKSQADDSSASGGEEWFAWISKTGARIFGGDQPWEISREIYPDWAKISSAYQQYCWALNDPASRTIYFGLAFPGNPQGVANRVYSINYVGLDSAFAIGTTGPIKIGFSGKRIATDHSRKWTRWNPAVYLNGAALMSRGAGDLEPVFFGGNGTSLNSLAGPGQAFTLNAAKYTDDTYGQLAPYYTTFFIPGDEMEEAKEIAGIRKLLVYLMAYISSPVAGSILTVTGYADQLTTPWTVTTTRALAVNPLSDIEMAANSVIANRFALKFSVAPPSGTDCGFNLQRLAVWFRKARLSVRGTV